MSYLLVYLLNHPYIFFECKHCGNKIEVYWERKNISRKRKRQEWVTEMKSLNGKVSYSNNRM